MFVDRFLQFAAGFANLGRDFAVEFNHFSIAHTLATRNSVARTYKESELRRGESGSNREIILAKLPIEAT